MRIVMPVYKHVEMLDVCGPHEMLRWAPGLHVDLVAEKPGLVAFNRGFLFQVLHGLGPAKPCDALWVPGGNPKSLSRIIHDPKQTYIEFLRRQAAASRYICSVCEGALLLAAAGLLDGYRVTTHWAFIPYLMDNYPKVTVADGHPRFVLDRNRLTGGGISSGLDEGLKLIELLTDTATAESVQKTTQYYPDPPVSSEIPNTITSPMPASRRLRHSARPSAGTR
jgi:transcriptional regulator GlxA family with amidase domain